MLAVLAFFPIPILVYRLYSLTRANYSLDRDQLTLTWGLRVEQIPVSDIEWVRPLSAMAKPFPLPFFRLPGSVLGLRRHPDLGPIEFLASDAKSLLLVATSRQIFAISPEAPADFLQEIQHAIEMGSLSPAVPKSVYPSFVVAQAWDSPLARYLWLAGFFVNIGLLAWVSLMAPSLGHISLGFLPSGAARPPSPGLTLILLPIVSIFFYLVGWVAGLMIYRREDRRPMAYIVWASGVVSSLLFLLAVLFIVIRLIYSLRMTNQTPGQITVSSASSLTVEMLQNMLQLILGFLFAAIIAFAAYRARSLSRSGAWGALLEGTIIFGLGGWRWAVLLLAFFISSSALTRAFAKRKAALNEKFDKGGTARHRPGACQRRYCLHLCRAAFLLPARLLDLAGVCRFPGGRQRRYLGHRTGRAEPVHAAADHQLANRSNAAPRAASRSTAPWRPSAARP